MVEAEVRLSRPTYISCLATAPIRGVVGNILLRLQPGTGSALFKPGLQGATVSPYVFRLISPPDINSDSFRFVMTAFDPGCEVALAMLPVFHRMPGLPFGRGGVRIEEVKPLAARVGSLLELAQAALHGRAAHATGKDHGRAAHATNAADHGRVAKISFITPLALKRGTKIMGADAFSLGLLGAAIARRLNALSETYGKNSTPIDSDGTERWDGQAVILEKQLEWQSFRRLSAPQDQMINLAGLVGWLRCRSIPPDLRLLLAAATVTHVGKHATDGCGAITIEN